MNTAIVSPRSDRMLPASAIFNRRSTPVPSTSSRAVLASAVALLPAIADDRAADLIEHLARAIVDLEDELRALRALLSEALAMTHTQHVEMVRRQKRLVDLLDRRRQERMTAT
jgi:hypothetical protein